MSEVWRIVLTASVTIAGGVIIYAAGRLFVALFVEPIHHLRSLIGEIADSLVFHADVYGNPGTFPMEKMDQVRETLRSQASQLSARAYCLPWYGFWGFIKVVPSKREIQQASQEIIGLSNSVHRGNAAQNVKTRKQIEKLLGIRKANSLTRPS